MKIKVNQGNITEAKADAVVLFSYEDDFMPAKTMTEFNALSNNLIRKMIDAGTSREKQRKFK